MNSINIRKIVNLMGKHSILEVKPRKELPKYLIYFNRWTSNYTLVNSETGKSLGKMCARPEAIYDNTYYPANHPYSSFYISSLWVDPKHRREGVGKALINLAKVESFRRGGDGRVHLIAQKLNDQESKPPQIFYRKQGFTSQYKWQIATIDRCIMNNEELPKNMRWITPMFLPIKKICEYCNIFRNKKYNIN